MRKKENAADLPGPVRAAVFRTVLLCGLFLALALTSACGHSESAEQVQMDFFAMDTYMTISAYGEEAAAQAALEAARAEIEKLDGMLNAVPAEDSSEGADAKDGAIVKLNAAGEGILPPEGAEVLKKALVLSEETDGAFDPTIYPLVKLWGFPDRELHLPDEGEVAECLKLVGTDGIFFNEETGQVTFARAGMALDLGGIAKGCASEKAAEELKRKGVTAALINLGGNVLAVGEKPDGTAFRVAVQDPDDQAKYLGIVEVRDACVITSGPYERYFEEDGVRYHHILDPETGYPADSGLASVTVVARDAAMADGLSTALFVMGREKAEVFWRAHRDDFEMILMTDDRQVRITPGLADKYSSELAFDCIAD